MTPEGRGLLDHVQEYGIGNSLATTDELRVFIRTVEAQAGRLDADRLQRAMRAAHGRRISTTETYAQAIARNYNRILDEEAAR